MERINDSKYAICGVIGRARYLVLLLSFGEYEVVQATAGHSSQRWMRGKVMDDAYKAIIP